MGGTRLFTFGVAVALLAACGGASSPGGGSSPSSMQGGAGATAAPGPSGPSSASTSPTPTTPPHVAVRLPVGVYLMRGETLVPAQRTVPVRDKAVAAAAVTALLQGPTPGERAAGLATAVPAGTRLNAVAVDGGTADVDLTSAYASGGGSLSMNARLAQVVYTVTQFATIRRVTFRLDGKPVTALGGEGILLDRPVTRARFTSLLPPVFVDVPARGAVVTSPLRVQGLANVTEGQFVVEVRRSDGTVLARAAAHAAMGMYAPFAVTLAFTTRSARAGAVVAYDRSLKDGSVIDEIRVPVTLEP